MCLPSEGRRVFGHVPTHPQAFFSSHFGIHGTAVGWAAFGKDFLRMALCFTSRSPQAFVCFAL